MVVLEARDRVGGRIWTHHLSDGTPVDRGGAWLGPKHDAILGLAREVDVSTYKTWVKGAHLLVGGGRTRRYTGLIPNISPLAVLSIALAQAKVDRMAKHVPIDAPWTAKRAEEWDARTVASWLERTGIRTTLARDDHVIVDAGDLSVSAHHAVVSVPPALAVEIEFDPVLPDDRLTLYRGAVAGP